MEKTFKHSEVEARLIKHWEETNAFNAGVHTTQSANSTFSIVIPPPNVTGLSLIHISEPTRPY